MTPPTHKTHSPAFRVGLNSIVRGDIIIPVLRSYLTNPEFKGFNIAVHGLGGREPDGWFHPSEHPRWPLRALWLYLTVPSLIEREPLDPSSLMAMTVGSVWHAIIERCLLDLDVLISNEVKLEHPATLTRGKADGLLRSNEMFELKSMKDQRLRKIETVEDFIEMYPDYYLQAQEYMRISGYHRMRFLLLALTFPFEMKEFVVEYDHAAANRTATKYAQAIQMAADGDVPMCDGCAPKLFCPARNVCQTATSDQIKVWTRGSAA